MARYQLTYAAVSASEGRSGGWRVLETSPGMPSWVAQTLEAAVVTRIDEVVMTHEFASQRDLDARVHSLTFQPFDHYAVWCNAVVAGKDATGRPGNVFTHAVLVENLSVEQRPIDLWRSQGWLTPFGSREVSAARLPVSTPEPKAHGRDAALSRAFGSVASTECLLAAVTACFQDHKPLILSGEALDDVVEWMQVVSWLTGGRVSQRIPFCTFVRSSDLVGLPREFRVLALPGEDLEAAFGTLSGRDSDPLILNVDELPSESAAERTWQYREQVWNAGTHWQDALFLLSQMDHDAVTALSVSMDRLVADLKPGEHLSPEWPLVLALLREKGREHPEADALIREWRKLQPWDGLTDPGLLALFQPEAGELVVGTDGDDQFLDFLDPSPDGEFQEHVEARHAEPVEPQEEIWFQLTSQANEVWPRYDSLELGVASPAALLGPLLDIIESASEDDQATLKQAIALCLGLCSPQDAGPLQVERATNLLALGDELSSALIEFLERWQDAVLQLGVGTGAEAVASRVTEVEPINEPMFDGSGDE